MRKLILVILLASGLATTYGCAAFTPAEVQSTVATLNADLPVIADAVAKVTTNQKLLRDLDIIKTNVSQIDQLINH